MMLLPKCTESLLTPTTNTPHVRPSNVPDEALATSVVEPVSSSINVSIGMVTSAACTGEDDKTTKRDTTTPMTARGTAATLFTVQSSHITTRLWVMLLCGVKVDFGVFEEAPDSAGDEAFEASCGFSFGLALAGSAGLWVPETVSWLVRLQFGIR